VRLPTLASFGLLKPLLLGMPFWLQSPIGAR
jgi:hypothetical protein